MMHTLSQASLMSSNLNSTTKKYNPLNMDDKMLNS